MPNTTILHFASPFAFSMPVQKSRADPAGDAEAQTVATLPAHDTAATLSDAAGASDSVSPAAGPDTGEASSDGSGSSHYAMVLRHYAEQSAPPAEDPESAAAASDADAPPRPPASQSERPI